jgi:succinate dehydrogenase / fumarate reductase flavoprotein subunit
MTTIPGLFVLGEANFSDHGANRLGASALMQGLADGYFVIPYTLGGYLGAEKLEKVDVEHAAFADAEREADERIQALLNVKGKRTVDDIHRELGHVMWNHCGMERNAEGLAEARRRIPEIRDAYWQTVNVPGSAGDLNNALERANRVADYLEFAQLMVQDADYRSESCGGHFRSESQTEEGEALRKDDEFSHVAAWEFKGVGQDAALHREELSFEYAKPSQRSYK